MTCVKRPLLYHKNLAIQGCGVSSRLRRGFSLIELLVVMVVITALAGLTYGYIDYARHRSLLAASEGLVQSVATAIVNHQGRYWQFLDQGQLRSVPIFDVNRDGLLDGDPVRINAVNPNTYSASLVASEYPGFLGLTGVGLPRRNVNELGQVVDSWGQALRIAFDAQRYGANRFGIWSIGPDGVDGTIDDIRSWESLHE
ncbi:MAG: prepilin-type N-terminal cleavage/methylation domain-containing protein [Planctomycetota bacterium]|nr:MAG: prepilin-type N-terminal cleavage/methylation domain-containing protein [Planctomycetota bacterium]